MALTRLYRRPALGTGATERIRREGGLDPGAVESEYCLYIQSSRSLSGAELAILRRRLATSYLPEGITTESQLTDSATVIEIGPRLTFQTVASSTTTSVFNDCGLHTIERVERSVRLGTTESLGEKEIGEFVSPLFRKMVFDRMTQERYMAPLTTLEPDHSRGKLVWIPIMEQGMPALTEFCQANGIAFDDQDMDHLFWLFHELEKRDATDAELRYLGNQLSGHCSHDYWKGLRKFNGRPAERTLMGYAKLPWEVNPGNALIAFNDEGSSWRGIRPANTLAPLTAGGPSPLIIVPVYFHPVLADESHCHPSKVCPKEGAATGVARVRDGICVARGAEMGCGHLAIIVGNMCIEGFTHEWEDSRWVPIGAVAPLEIATEARLGAWGFGNALGEPVPGGSFITFGVDPGDGYRSFFKPDVFTGGLSLVRDEHVVKTPASPGKHLAKWGGPRLPIGLGGGFRSSTSADVGDDLELAESHDYDSVQRGAPEMQQRGVRVVRGSIESADNPLDFPKDGGAGGDGTAISETAEPCGVEVAMRDIPSGDLTMSPDVHINNESQEQQYSAVEPGAQMEHLASIARRERCPFTDIGVYEDSGRVVFRDDWAEGRDRYPINLPLAPIFGKRPQKIFNIETTSPVRHQLRLPSGLAMSDAVNRVLRLPSVACKGWLTNHVDRSVSGRIAQQSCIGPYQLPSSDYWIMANSPHDTVGTVMASAVRPHLGLISGKALANMTLAEALISVSGAVNEGLDAIGCEINWFSDAKAPGEGQVIEETASTLADAMIKVGMRQLGGKDSSAGSNLALSPAGQQTKVKWPVTIFVTLGVQMANINRKVTPLIEGPSNTLIHVDLSPELKPLGASALSQVFGQTGNDCADVQIERVIAYFNETQRLLRHNLIRSLHDVSDGGLITTLLEMAFVSGVGLDIESRGRFGWLRHYFSEVPGVVLACRSRDAATIIAGYRKAGIKAQKIAKVVRSLSPEVRVEHNYYRVLREDMLSLRQLWMETSFRLDARDSNPVCVESERRNFATLLTPPPFELSFVPQPTPKRIIRFKDKPKVAILRAPGSNGDRELAGLFYEAGFEPWDIMTTDLFDGRAGLDQFQAAAQSGGFSYQDEPMEAGVGWSASVEENPYAWEQYHNFYIERQDTVSYHPCNGTQVASLLGLAPDHTLPLERRPRFLSNNSGMFESRYVTVKIESSPSIMFKGMEGSVLGIIVAHGEGQLYCHDQSVMDWILTNNLVPMTYVGPDGKATMEYPFNPNGSPLGIAGLTTLDGRHTITMPHVERLWQLWQFPWMPYSWRKLKASPYARCGQNLYDWCMEHREV